MSDHQPAVARILARDLPQVAPTERAQAAAEIAAYIDQLVAGQDKALRELKRDDHACGQISLAQARTALHADPLVGVPRPRTRPRVTEAANGSWVEDKHGSAS